MTSTLSEYGHRNKTLWILIIAVSVLVLSTCDLRQRLRQLNSLSVVDDHIPSHSSTKTGIELRHEHLEPYPERNETEARIRNGTFDWTKTKSSILFLKKHKCASSTSATVITNYFKWRGLDDEGKIFKSLGGCYPAKWNPYCRPGGHYLDYLPSIKYHHRLNLDVQLPLMAPNTTLITTIRNPLSFLHSSYNYFYQKFSRLDYGGPGCNVECSGEPYYGWLGNRTEVPVTKFLDILDDAYEPNDKYSFRARNFQCYEMGLDEKADADEDAMRDNIARLLNQFDGIIITERFLESLVLLAAVLHIPVEYLYAVSENISAKYEKPSLSKEQMATFQKYFRMDIMLYELAEKKMERQIESFGRERMNRELEKLHQLQALCEGDKSICSRKRHVRLSSDPRQAQILAASNHVPHEARRNTMPMERDKVWSIIQSGGGGCKYGLHRNLVDHEKSWPTCVNSTKYISWWQDQ